MVQKDDKIRGRLKTGGRLIFRFRRPLLLLKDKTMHYFSIHTRQGAHVGFFIMLADDESEAEPQSGRFALKLQSEDAPEDQEAATALQPWQDTAEPLFWRVENGRVELFAADSNIGSIRNEYLTLSGQMLVLNDLTGTM